MKIIGYDIVFALLPFIALSWGCQSTGHQPMNPFAMDRQTIPPPSTYSYQQSILGQPSSTYQPSAPATTYPASTPPPATTYPSAPPSGTTLFQESLPSTAYPPDLPPSTGLPLSSTPPSVTNVYSYSNEATTMPSPATVTIPVSEVTSQTAAENLDNRADLSLVLSPSGQAGYTYLGPAPVSASSSQIVTTVSD